MRKLVIGELDVLSGYISREFGYVTSALAENHGWDTLDVYELRHARKDLSTFLQQRFGRAPDVVLFRECYEDIVRHYDLFASAGSSVYVITEDLHTKPAHIDTALQLATGILSTYAPELRHFYSECDAARISWVPHAASPDFLLPILDNPEPVVFVSGHITAEYYPLRDKMRRLAARRPNLARVFAHPGYGWHFQHNMKAAVGPGYAAAIRRCLAAFTDASRFNYLVAKHFEIPATGALLIADRMAKAQLAILGFEDGTHYVSASADDLEEVVEWVLDHRNTARVDTIRRAGHDLVHRCHTTTHRARQIDETCSSARRTFPSSG